MQVGMSAKRGACVMAKCLREENPVAVSTEIARLRRVVEEFVAGVSADLRSKQGLSESDRRTLRAEIERCTQILDELRSNLSR
jgi:hypothetical protein